MLLSVYHVGDSVLTALGEFHVNSVVCCAFELAFISKLISRLTFSDIWVISING